MSCSLARWAAVAATIAALSDTLETAYGLDESWYVIADNPTFAAALADLAVPGPYDVTLRETETAADLAVLASADRSDLRVPPGQVADRLAGDPRAHHRPEPGDDGGRRCPGDRPRRDRHDGDGDRARPVHAARAPDERRPGEVSVAVPDSPGCTPPPARNLR